MTTPPASPTPQSSKDTLAPLRASRRGYGVFWLKLGALIAVLVTLTPLVAVVYKALAPAPDLPDFPFWRYATTSLYLVIGVGVVALVLGTFSAWLVTLYEFPFRRFFSWALVLPLACPAFVLAYGWADFLDAASPLRSGWREAFGFDLPLNMRSLWGAIFVLSFAYFPYIYLTLRASFLSQSADMFDAARLLGLKPHQIFWRVALPLSRPALIAGLALTTMETLADYGAVNFLSVQTLTMGVVRAWSIFGSTALAAKLALVLIGAALLFLVTERFLRRGKRFAAGTARWRKQAPLPLSTGGKIAAVLFCTLLLMLGMLIPVVWLVAQAVHISPDWPRLISAAQSTLLLSSSGTALTLLLATLVVFGMRKNRLIGYLMSLGYATPGAVMAIGLLVPASLFWNQFALTSSLWLAFTLLLLAYAARLMASAYEPLQAGLTRLTPNLALAARTLGATQTEAVRRVELPLIRGTFLTAALLVFVDIAKELPATLILRPFELESLAVMADRYANDERLAQAAWPSLIILAVSILPSLYLSRRIERSGQNKS
ncbi:ABC transporter permease [Asticcacaulis tiandongensis]|uniref:ABC transporter permease n=1 Tax=Asticcacaulis tiandongensis TaxID=2565365 RepID=UPI001126DB52|nr:iron ABC transporter permease [Asticcacaulis tiandongensis]